MFLCLPTRDGLGVGGGGWGGSCFSLKVNFSWGSLVRAERYTFKTQPFLFFIFFFNLDLGGVFCLLGSDHLFIFLSFCLLYLC